jgi:hypothetical protein
LGRRCGARRGGGTRGGAIVGVVHTQATTAEVVTVEAADRIRCLRVASVLDESESARPAGFAIGADVDADDTSSRSEKLRELLLGRGEAQIADENLGRNDDLLWMKGFGLCVMGDGLGACPV